ncbi:hypothetical protein [Clostridium sp. JN-1]|uniref:hypothetical protein n=1 Tax=Clostridium sp. JN-1 TaxID=2483110 RepID=UPI000F0B1762|nr:hypothetical protein [Clostridium sp. JN-1]
MLILHKNVKKITLFIIMIFPLIFTGCTSGKKTESDKSNAFDIKAAANVTESYMNAVAKGNIDNISQFYSKKLSKSPANSENQNLKIFGYNIAETNEVGSAGLFKIMVSRSDLSKVFTSLDQYDVRISKEDNDYKVVDTKDSIEKEAFEQDGEIRLRSKNNANTNLVINFEGLPSYAFSKDDKANINKILVPKKFSLISFSYGGDSLAISTYDKNSFLGIVKIDETLAVQSSNGGDNNEQGGQGGGGQESQGQTKIKEKPIGKEVFPLDMLKDAKVEFMSFSPTEKFITAQYSTVNESKSLRVYKADSGDMIPFKFEDKYPIDKVNVLFSSYDKDNLNFDVVPKSANDKSVSNYIGKWQLDLKNFKEVKM